VGKETIFGEQIQTLRKIIETQDYETGQGVYDTYEIIPEYMDFMQKNIQIKKRHNIAIDAGNGVVGLIAPKLFESMNCQVTPLYLL